MTNNSHSPYTGPSKRARRRVATIQRWLEQNAAVVSSERGHVKFLWEKDHFRVFTGKGESFELVEVD